MNFEKTNLQKTILNAPTASIKRSINVRVIFDFVLKYEITKFSIRVLTVRVLQSKFYPTAVQSVRVLQCTAFLLGRTKSVRVSRFNA